MLVLSMCHMIRLCGLTIFQPPLLRNYRERGLGAEGCYWLIEASAGKNAVGRKQAMVTVTHHMSVLLISTEH